LRRVREDPFSHVALFPFVVFCPQNLADKGVHGENQTSNQHPCLVFIV